MKTIELIQVAHKRTVGERCEYIEPNVTEDALLVSEGQAIGFYLSKMPERMCRLAEVANAEFRSKNVPKSLLERSDVMAKVYEQGMTRKAAKASATIQMSAIIGSIPPKPHMRRMAPNISSVHNHPSAKTFVKAMLMLAKESEALIADILPEQHKRQVELFKSVPDKWKFGGIFTSSISNYNISAAFHKDAGNIVGSVNVIICKRLNAKGGDLHVPDYGATFGQADGSVLVYPAWKNLHGVTPITPTHPGGYRNSLVFYPLKAFVNAE